jgi:hypothetical protein
MAGGLAVVEVDLSEIAMDGAVEFPVERPVDHVGNIAPEVVLNLILLREILF